MQYTVIIRFVVMTISACLIFCQLRMWINNQRSSVIHCFLPLSVEKNTWMWHGCDMPCRKTLNYLIIIFGQDCTHVHIHSHVTETKTNKTKKPLSILLWYSIKSNKKEIHRQTLGRKSQKNAQKVQRVHGINPSSVPCFQAYTCIHSIGSLP